MFGIIGFENLLIHCIIGINPEERLVEQMLLLNLQAEENFTPVAKTDDLTNAVSYVELANLCTEIAQKGKYNMLETLANDLVRQLKTRFKLSWIKILIKKPDAIKTAELAFVELEYGKRKRKP